MAATHSVTTTHDLRLSQAYVEFRNEVLWPTRKLQRLLTAACVVAVGFMFAPGPLRYLLWSVAGIIVLFVLVGDRIDARAHHGTDPHRSQEVRYLFAAEGFREHDDASGPNAWVPYSHIVAAFADSDYWILRLESGDLVMLARGGVDRGASTSSQFESFLTQHTGVAVLPVQKTLRAKVQRAQDGRRGYIESHPGLLTKALRQRSDNDRDDESHDERG